MIHKYERCCIIHLNSHFMKVSNHVHLSIVNSVPSMCKLYYVHTRLLSLSLLHSYAQYHLILLMLFLLLLLLAVVLLLLLLLLVVVLLLLLLLLLLLFFFRDVGINTLFINFPKLTMNFHS